LKTIDPTLQADIENGTISTFIKLTRKDLTQYGFSDHDNELTIDGLIYYPTPGLTRLTMSQGTSAEVSNQEITGAYILDIDEGDLSSGVYDEAEIVVSKRSWVNPEVDQLIIFKGDLGLISWTSDGYKADVHSAMQDLSRVVGTTVTAKCRHDLFDQSDTNRIGFCGVNKGSFTFNGSVTNAISKVKFDQSGVGSSSIVGGLLTFDSGLNSGLSYEVKKLSGSTITLFLPTAFNITNGDTFTVYAGCDKTQGTCKGTFNNFINFGGFPHIRNETNFK